MSILTDKEIDYWIGSNTSKKSLSKAIELAVLEKLAGTELPKPLGFMWQHDETGRVGFAEESQREPWLTGNPRLAIVRDIHTSAQLHQAYAQGAASQLSAEPVAGQSRFDGVLQWTPCTPEHVGMVINASSEFKGYQVRYLYTRKDAK